MSLEDNSELFEHYDFTASSGQAPLRVDKFLMNFIDNATRSKIQKAALNGNILVNSHPVKSSYKVKAGDRVMFGAVDATTSSRTISINQEEYLLVPESQVFGIIEES